MTPPGLVHSLTSHPVTVGSAGVRWRENYLSLGLDFYQVHWYDNLEAQPIGDAGRRCWASIVQCCSVNFRHGDRVGTFDDIVGTARAAGYSGALYWSVLSNDKSSA